MVFSEYKYERPDIKGLANKINELVLKIQEEENIDEIKKKIDEVNKIKSFYSTMQALCSIRNTLNTVDKYYEDEQEYFDTNGPIFSSADTKFSKALVNHSKRKELEAIYGTHWFKMMETALKAFDDAIIEDCGEENQLITKYNKLLSSAKIEFDGKINNLSQMGKYSQNKDRNIRHSAALKVQEFLLQHEKEFDDVYDKLVKVRDRMAKKLGYKNYVDFGYARLGRTDYDAKMVKNYRDQVYRELVPLVSEIYKNQAKRIGIKDFKFYDMSYEYVDGNAIPKGTREELVKCATKMYSEMSMETKEFFDFMVEHELLDLDAREGKMSGGYTTYISDYKSPYIFANFNGTSGDVDVLTHEAGHAFQCFRASKIVDNPDYIWPTLEACEIHSMSMEFFAYPWIDLFFKEDTKKYKNSHRNSCLTFIPYGVTIDEFQHYVYENPEASPEERKSKYREIEKKYLPFRDYDDLDVFNRGGFWFRQLHVFQSPFYYIDYTLAQVCALQFYLDSLDNRKDAWNRYIKLCNLGGTKSFLELIKEVGINNPFEEGSIRKMVTRLLPVIKNESI